ncbi:MAG: hypothetical protein ACK42G_04290 [Candidatus Kapaibacteriota bacterium]
MKNFSLLFVLVLFAFAFNTINSTAQTVVVTSPDGSSKTFNSIPEALNGASDGDIVYLPAGSFDGNIVINKRLQIIGAGYNTKVRGADGVTYLTGSVRIVTGASGGSLQGVYISGEIRFGTDASNQKVDNYVISRCFVNFLYLGVTWDAENTNDNILITENIIEGAMFGAKASNVKVIKNVLRQTSLLGRLATRFKNAVFSNNIFIPLDDYPFNDVTGCIMQNNIITNGKFSNVNDFANNQFLNNLYTSTDGLTTGGVVRSEGNVRMDLEEIFVNYKGGPLTFDDDYHLTPKAINAIRATDGGQVGLYGTDSPFKDYGIPVNPAIKEAKISPMTNSKGQLKINFKVEAQSK